MYGWCILIGKQVKKGRGTCRVYLKPENRYPLRTIEQHERDAMANIYISFSIMQNMYSCVCMYSK